MTKTAIIYTRFSPRPDADTSKSNEQQEKRCRDYCCKHGYNVSHVCSDSNISGSKMFRPGLSNALFALLSFPKGVLVADSPDRLARDLLVSLTIRKQVEELGCTIEYADGSPSGDEPEAILMQNIMAAFASYERSRYSRRTKAGMARKKADGVWCGRPPIGWKIDSVSKSLVRNVSEHRVISAIITWSKEKYSSHEIVEFLNNNHWPLCRGRQWNTRTIRRIIERNKK